MSRMLVHQTDVLYNLYFIPTHGIFPPNAFSPCTLQSKIDQLHGSYSILFVGFGPTNPRNGSGTSDGSHCTRNHETARVFCVLK